MAELELQKEKALGLLGDVTVSFGETERPQYVQDLPIRYNVWRAFAEDPKKKHSLLITPNNRIQISQAVKELCDAFIAADDDQNSTLAIKNMIWTKTTMDQFFMVILPCTCWFKSIDSTRLAAWKISFQQAEEAECVKQLQTAFRESPEKALWRLLAGWSVIQYSHKRGEEGTCWERLERGCTALLEVTQYGPPLHEYEVDRQTTAFREIKSFLNEAKFAVNAFEDISTVSKIESIWAVDLNRRAELATNVSRKTVKIDAAERLFEGTSSGISWAVIDSGIDAEHPAFTDTALEHPDKLSSSRVVATYDFNRLMLLSEQRYTELLPEAEVAKLDKIHTPKARKNPRSLEDAVLMRLFQLSENKTPQHLSQRSLESSLDDEYFRESVREYIEDVKRRITDREPIDWALLEPVLRIPHTTDCYKPPKNSHGTHVAGTIAGNMSAGALGDGQPKWNIRGMCPEMKLYDLRVCDDQGVSDEFLVVAALQFIDYLNKSQDRVLIHGANISLQIQHLVRNYGCGQTPVCREANNLVANGVVVVAAAGNRGFNKVHTENGPVDTYSWSSITDPGNAENVITVGSTHRKNPYSYGVSFFSSRGPTGDGRPKPDLVAPGEKIVAPFPKSEFGPDTGTSMAAPHVSGAAALLLARYPELVGNPLKVKQILCDTASDLGRRREFQGAGLVDVLRALQSL